MEPFTFDSGKLKGVEVLFFEDAQVDKLKGDSTSFSAMGPLSVLYFKNYDRFVLRLNGWTYPLMRRLPITSDDKSFNLPAANGFSYRLILNNPAPQAFANLETILSHNSTFGNRKLSASPDDKVLRKTSIHKEVTVAGMIKHGVEKVKEVAKDLTASKKKPLAKKRMMPGSIKRRNYRKSAKATFRKDFFETENRLTKKFLEHRRDNANLKETREFSDLKKTPENLASTLFLRKEGMEDAIIRQQEMIKARGLGAAPEKKGIVESIKEGVAGLKDKIEGMIHREAPKEQTISGQQGLVEGMTHYHA